MIHPSQGTEETTAISTQETAVELNRGISQHMMVQSAASAEIKYTHLFWTRTFWHACGAQTVHAWAVLHLSLTARPAQPDDAGACGSSLLVPVTIHPRGPAFI